MRKTRKGAAAEPSRGPKLGLVTTGGSGSPSGSSGARLRLVTVRWGKVRTAQARVAAGYYDRDSVRERVLDAVLDVLRKR